MTGTSPAPSRPGYEAGHDIHQYAHPRELMKIAGRESFDLFLIDWNLPEISGEAGADLAQEGPRGHDPGDLRDGPRCRRGHRCGAGRRRRRLHREAGAAPGVLSRIEAVLRRSRPREPERDLDLPPYHFDLIAKQCYVHGELAELTDKEFELALFLFRNLGRLLSRGHLLRSGLGPQSQPRDPDNRHSRLAPALKLALRPRTATAWSQPTTTGTDWNRFKPRCCR